MTIGTITNTISKASSTKAAQREDHQHGDRRARRAARHQLDPGVEQPVGAEGAEHQREGGRRDEQREQRAAHRHGVAQHGAEGAGARPPLSQPNSSSAVPPIAAASTA